MMPSRSKRVPQPALKEDGEENMCRADNVPPRVQKRTLASEDAGGTRRSKRERSGVHRFVAGPASGDAHSYESAKFHLVPANGWHRFVWSMGCHALNTIKWKGERPLPSAPRSTTCWLLPATDDMAITIARLRPQLLAAGWQLLTSEEEVVERLSNKAALARYAAQLNMLDSLPQHYAAPEVAVYPCILKAALGEHGKNVHIVRSADEATAIATEGYGTDWLLQELCPGAVEHSVSLLVRDGVIADAVSTEYTYDKEEYVWPDAEEVGRSSSSKIPPKHLETMRRFLSEYTGVCNFNYKVRPSGELCIFEVNTRVGADLACDVPRRRARAFFEKLDGFRALRSLSAQPAQ